MRKGIAEAAEHCRKLEREYPWIPDEQPHFGKQGTDYDWNARDPEKVSVRGRGGVVDGAFLVS